MLVSLFLDPTIDTNLNLGFMSVFLGYSTSHKDYKCLSPTGKLFISKDVVFNEVKFPYLYLFLLPSKLESPSINPTSLITFNSFPLNPLPATLLLVLPLSIPQLIEILILVLISMLILVLQLKLSLLVLTLKLDLHLCKRILFSHQICLFLILHTV